MPSKCSKLQHWGRRRPVMPELVALVRLFLFCLRGGMECALSLVLKQKIAASAPAPCPTSTLHHASLFFAMSSKRLRALTVESKLLVLLPAAQVSSCFVQDWFFFFFQDPLCFTSAAARFQWNQIFSLYRTFYAEVVWEVFVCLIFYEIPRMPFHWSCLRSMKYRVMI